MKAVVTLLLLMAVSEAAIAQNNTDAEKSKIVALENAWNLAEQHKDVKAMNELLSSSMVYIDYVAVSRLKNSFWRVYAGHRFIPNRS